MQAMLFIFIMYALSMLLLFEFSYVATHPIQPDRFAFHL